MHLVKRMNRLLLLLSCTGLLLTACHNAAQKQDSSDVANDKNNLKFDDKASEKQASLIVEAVAAGYQALQLADLAARTSTRSDVKQIADGLRATHTALLDRFKAWSLKSNISVPAEPTKEARDDYERIAKLPPAQFDKKWCEALIEQHRKLIADIESGLPTLPEGEIRKVLSEALPPLREENDKLMQYHHQL